MQNFLIIRCVADGVERLGADPRHSAELQLDPAGNVAGLRRHDSPGAAGGG